MDRSDDLISFSLPGFALGGLALEGRDPISQVPDLVFESRSLVGEFPQASGRL